MAAGIGRSRLCLGESQNSGKEPGVMEDIGGCPMPPPWGSKGIIILLLTMTGPRCSQSPKLCQNNKSISRQLYWTSLLCRSTIKYWAHGQREIHCGQDASILTTQVANYCSEFTSACLLVKWDTDPAWQSGGKRWKKNNNHIPQNPGYKLWAYTTSQGVLCGLTSRWAYNPYLFCSHLDGLTRGILQYNGKM